MSQSPSSFFYNRTAFDIFSEQYIECYAKLRNQYPEKSIRDVMRLAKDVTIEYLYQAARQELPRYIKAWPRGFKP